MRVQTRKALGIVAAAVLAGFACAAQAQNYPNRPVKIVMPWLDGFPANSTRLYAQELTKRLGQSFIVDVRSGAGGEVAARQVIPSAADGYTLLATGSSITTRAAADVRNADGGRDLTPIGFLTTTPYVIVAKAGKFGDFKHFLAEAKASPGKINYASAGVGTGMHFLGELINANADVSIVHVPYPTGSQQLQAVMAGDVDVAVISLVTALPQIKAGTLEALAVSTDKRSDVAPQIPTLWELGLKGIPSMSAWIALLGPKDLDPAAARRLSEQLAAIAHDPQAIAAVHAWGAEFPDTSTAYFKKTLAIETQAWKRLIAERHLDVGGGR